MLAVNNNIDTEYSFLLVPVYKTIVCNDWYDMATGETSVKTWSDVVSYYKISDVIVHTNGSVSYNESYVDIHGNYTSSEVADALYLNQFRSSYSFVEVPMH